MQWISHFRAPKKKKKKKFRALKLVSAIHNFPAKQQKLLFSMSLPIRARTNYITIIQQKSPFYS